MLISGASRACSGEIVVCQSGDPSSRVRSKDSGSRRLRDVEQDPKEPCSGADLDRTARAPICRFKVQTAEPAPEPFKLHVRLKDKCLKSQKADRRPAGERIYGLVFEEVHLRAFPAFRSHLRGMPSSVRAPSMKSAVFRSIAHSNTRKGLLETVQGRAAELSQQICSTAISGCILMIHIEDP
jgi:hypothetical protein